MRENMGRWVVFGVLVSFLGWILLTHNKGGESDPSVDGQVPPSKESVVSKVLESAHPKGEPLVEAEFNGYYPQQPQELKQEIQSFLKKAKRVKAKGSLVGLITPHAGMEYSGAVAAEAYKQLAGLKFDTVVILVPNHEAYNMNSITICPKGEWLTPLGKVAVDEALAKALKKESSEFEFSVEAFEKEHSFDLQLPFLQEVLGAFNVLPILLGGDSSERAWRLADALSRTSGDKAILYIATTHFSKGEVYEKAKRIDFLATSALEEMDVEKLRRYERENLLQMCGYTPVLTLMYFLKEKRIDQGKLFKYANTADVTGQKKGMIVGYAALGFYQ